MSTTTSDFGLDYDEDLIEAMAKGGDGNYYFIETPKQLADIFQTELQGLVATIGQKVSLGFEPGDGVRVTDVLNDFATNEYGRRLLPNLLIGMPLNVVVRLVVPPMTGPGDVCRFRLAWDYLCREGRQELWTTLKLPVVPADRWQGLEAATDVQEHAALLMAARARDEAVRALDRNDPAASALWVAEAHLLASALPPSPLAATELIEIMRAPERPGYRGAQAVPEGQCVAELFAEAWQGAEVTGL